MKVMCRVRHLSSSQSSHTVLSTQYSDTTFLLQMLPIDFLMSRACVLSLTSHHVPQYLDTLQNSSTPNLHISNRTSWLSVSWAAEKVLCCHPGPKHLVSWITRTINLPRSSANSPSNQRSRNSFYRISNYPPNCFSDCLYSGSGQQLIIYLRTEFKEQSFQTF